MWMFTKYGFFSAVQNKDDPKLIHVRSQFKGDLERLIEWAGKTDLTAKGDLKGKCPNVIETPYGDYAFRADFLRGDWEIICKALARDIDYVKAKPAMHDGTVRDSIYLNVFFEMYRGKPGYNGRRETKTGNGRVVGE